MKSPGSNGVEPFPSRADAAEDGTGVLPGSVTGQGLSCRRCGECCRRYQVRLDLAEAEAIAGRLGLTGDEFRGRYADRRWPGERSMLIRQENGACPFLERSAEGGDDLCAIHDFKPSSCREWMAGVNRKECQTGLARRRGLVPGRGGEVQGPVQRLIG